MIINLSNVVELTVALLLAVVLVALAKKVYGRLWLRRRSLTADLKKTITKAVHGELVKCNARCFVYGDKDKQKHTLKFHPVCDGVPLEQAAAIAAGRANPSWNLLEVRDEVHFVRQR